MVALRAAAVKALVGFLDWYRFLFFFFPFSRSSCFVWLGFGVLFLSLVVVDFFWQMIYRFWLDIRWLLFGLLLLVVGGAAGFQPASLFYLVSRLWLTFARYDLVVSVLFSAPSWLVVIGFFLACLSGGFIGRLLLVLLVYWFWLILARYGLVVSGAADLSACVPVLFGSLTLVGLCSL